MEIRGSLKPQRIHRDTVGYQVEDAGSRRVTCWIFLGQRLAVGGLVQGQIPSRTMSLQFG